MTLTLEIIPLGDEFPNCSDPSCDLDASVYIFEDSSEPKTASGNTSKTEEWQTPRLTAGKKRPWCTGHAHIEIAMFMVGL